ncbi:MAG: FmdB family zinc ribbon protein [Verrucomicrobiales bacterium]
MPTYDYECEKCGERFEVFQNMSAERLTKCQDEACGGKVKRLIGTGAGLLFKGSGFYITDYRSDSYKAGAKSDSSAGGGKSETKKTDSKKSDTGGKKKSGGSGSTKSSS